MIPRGGPWLAGLSLAGLSLVVAGCTVGGGSVPETRGYLLRRGPPMNSAATPDAASLRLARPDVASHIQGITVVRPDRVVDTLVYHTWAAPVSEMVADWVRMRLLESSRWSQVYDSDMDVVADMRLAITVHRFEILESPDGTAEAVVTLEALLLGSSTRQLAPQRVEGHRACPPGADFPALVASLGEALAHAADALALALER